MGLPRLIIAKVEKGIGYDLATKPDSKKGRIAHQALNEFIGKTITFQIIEVK